jgi:hypothetical protein
MRSKKISTENKVLIALALISISIGLWGNFRQLWLQDNSMNVGAISNVLSIGTFVSVFGIILISKFISSSKMRSFITFALGIKIMTLLGLFFLNSSDNIFLIKALTIFDMIFETLIIIGIYPLITLIKIDDNLYSKRKLIEYLFKDLGILVGGIFIGKTILGIAFSYNICLIISIIFLIFAFLVMTNIKIINYETKVNSKNKVNFINFIKKSKLHQVYIFYSLVSNVAMGTGLGLKMLIITNYFNFSPSGATNYLLIVGLIADVLGILALKYFTPKNDYLTITIKFGLRFLGYTIAFLSNNIIITIIAVTWSILISTSYENITDAPYINKVPKEHQLMVANIKKIFGAIGESVGIFFCGLMYNIGLRYIFGLSAFFMIFQILIAYFLIYLRNKGKNIKEEMIA